MAATTTGQIAEGPEWSRLPRHEFLMILHQSAARIHKANPRNPKKEEKA